MEHPKCFNRTHDINIYDVIFFFIKEDGMMESKYYMEWFMKIKMVPRTKS